MSWRTLVNHTFKKLNNAIFTFPSSHQNRVFQFLPISQFTTNLHSSQSTTNALIDPKRHQTLQNDTTNDEETTNEFLSRFVWRMRKKVKEAFPDSDKSTVDGMLVAIVERVTSEMENGGGGGGTVSLNSGDLSEDLWRTVWDVSNAVLEDMNKERKKEKMKGFLQCEEVKEMCRFAGEVGIRGDLLRELRFKWAREKMEEHEFYEGLEKLRKEAQTESGDSEIKSVKVKEEKKGVVELPKRRGKIKYKIYGLDLSDPKWAHVADRIHEAEQVFWPEEPKAITGKAKVVTEKILSWKMEDDGLERVLKEWVELVEPSRVDWVDLLEKLKEKNHNLFLKVAEMVLTEDSYQTSISDYSRLIDIYANENCVDDVERILKKMNENGINPDASIASTMVHMYCKGGNLASANEAFELLMSLGFKPDIKVYSSMIMAFVSSGQPRLGEKLMREMEARDIKPTKEIYMALFRSFCQVGDFQGTTRISTAMQFAGHEQSMETCTMLIEAYGFAGEPDLARSHFDSMIKLGHKPDDRATASMIAAYEKKNNLDNALNLLLELENDGFEPGVATLSVLVDWMGKLQLVDEAEQLLNKISLLGEAPPFKLQVSLCDMYARARNEKKALQALGVLEARKDELAPADFERIINGLIDGGFQQDAQRICKTMEAKGFDTSRVKVNLMKPVSRAPRMR